MRERGGGAGWGRGVGWLTWREVKSDTQRQRQRQREGQREGDKGSMVIDPLSPSPTHLSPLTLTLTHLRTPRPRRQLQQPPARRDFLHQVTLAAQVPVAHTPAAAAGAMRERCWGFAATTTTTAGTSVVALIGRWLGGAVQGSGECGE